MLLRSHVIVVPPLALFLNQFKAFAAGVLRSFKSFSSFSQKSPVFSCIFNYLFEERVGDRRRFVGDRRLSVGDRRFCVGDRRPKTEVIHISTGLHFRAYSPLPRALLLGFVVGDRRFKRHGRDKNQAFLGVGASKGSSSAGLRGGGSAQPSPFLRWRIVRVGPLRGSLRVSS